MRNILILNCGTTKDILMSSHLIGSYKEEHPNCRITVLTLEKNRAMASLLAHVSEIHYIDSEFICETEQNDLYPDSYALNEFSENIHPILKQQWDFVMNYSNDQVSAYLMKAVNANSMSGAFINEQGVVKTASKWATLQNYVLPNSAVPPIATALVRNHMLNTPLFAHAKKILINEDYFRIATQNFEKVRKMKSHAQTKIVGLNLEVGYSGHALDLQTLTSLVETFEESEQFKVVLLTSGKSYQKEIVSELNLNFNNKLISINVDSVAISSVVSNLDILISCANDQLSIADALEVKVIEVKEVNAKIRPTVIGAGNIIIYQAANADIIDDIILAINEEFETELPVNIVETLNPTYLCIQDEYGVSYSQMRGEIDTQKELRFHIERAVLFQTMGFAKDEQLIEQIQRGISKEEIQIFASSVKSEVTSTVKLLLASLRALKGAKNSKTQINSFITYLGNLIQAGNQDSLSSSLVRMFEGNIENIESTEIDANMQEIEDHLFELKTNLQTLMNFMGEIIEQPAPSPSVDISAS